MTQLLYTEDEAARWPAPVNMLRVVILHDTDTFLLPPIEVTFQGGEPKLKRVYEFRARHGLSTQLLEAIFEELNIGEESAVAIEYRALGLRSLSTGDVVVLGNVPWRCDSAGWTAFPAVPEPKNLI